MQTVELNIQGMTCGGCAKSVQRALLSVSGVVEATALFEQQKATVVFDENLVSPLLLTEAIEDAGFDVVEG